MNNIRAYLRIQLIMHDDSFTVEEEIDTSLFDCRVPKLILQPLVENAIDHGLDISGKEEQKLWITVGQEEETLLLSVRITAAGWSRRKRKRLLPISPVVMVCVMSMTGLYFCMARIIG